MSNPADSKNRRGGFGIVGLVVFRILPFLLCLVALFIGVVKATPEAFAEISLSIPHLGSWLIKLAELNWLVVIIITICAIVMAFAGSLMSVREESVSMAKWRDGVKIDRTKCAKSDCRRMRFAGKLLCPECWDEWKSKQPLCCAECGDNTINQNTTNPLCKLCHQRWLDT